MPGSFYGQLRLPQPWSVHRQLPPSAAQIEALRRPEALLYAWRDPKAGAQMWPLDEVPAQQHPQHFTQALDVENVLEIKRDDIELDFVPFPTHIIHSWPIAIFITAVPEQVLEERKCAVAMST